MDKTITIGCAYGTATLMFYGKYSRINPSVIIGSLCRVDIGVVCQTHSLVLYMHMHAEPAPWAILNIIM